MENRIEDVQYCEKLFDSFYDVGCTETGGVTRLGYSAQEIKCMRFLQAWRKN